MIKAACQLLPCITTAASPPAAVVCVCREYRKYWFFVNLQLSIDRALLGGQQSSGEYPAPLTIKVKPFPWPAKQEDLGAASAAAFFNLLLVYAFMAPTRVSRQAGGQPEGEGACGTWGAAWGVAHCLCSLLVAVKSPGATVDRQVVSLFKAARP